MNALRPAVVPRGIQKFLKQAEVGFSDHLALHRHVPIRFDILDAGHGLVPRIVEMVRDDYAALMLAHRTALSDLARSFGWSFATHHTDQRNHFP